MTAHTLKAVCVLTALTLAVPFAGAWEMNWWTVSSGGGSSAGGALALSGTIGQPHAGVLSGGAFALTGGFWTRASSAVRRGDLNCDGVVDFKDINAFVLLLSNQAAWQAAYPGCPIENGDGNADGRVTFKDIDPFVAILSGGA